MEEEETDPSALVLLHWTEVRGQGPGSGLCNSLCCVCCLCLRKAICFQGSEVFFSNISLCLSHKVRKRETEKS